MRTAVAGLVGAAVVVRLAALVAAAPPEDVAAYCRVTYPQLQLQLRCLNVEHAAASRVSQAAAAVDREMFGRCLTASPSWSATESCLTQAARGAPLPAPVAALPPPAERGAPLEQAAGPPATTAGVVPGATPPVLPGVIPPVLPGVIPPAAPPLPATAALGPLPLDPAAALAPLPAAAPAALAEPERPPRPISEADAEKHLRSVLERAGTPRARCTKKQYGPGWASICE
jgi:hypothetical protein